jgi:acetate kinase
MILVLNCGSQSIKWKIFDENLKLIKENKLEILDANKYKEILEEEVIKLKDLEVFIIGHRVVHGGGIFIKPLEITDINLQELEKINYLAPLHNPYNLLGIKVCQKIFTKSKNIAIFDTEFFKDLPEKVFTYALPENLGFRKFGFHGISHEFVSKNFKNKKVISVHLGGGSSIAAIKNGKAIDTSMGFTPMEGLVMMTRAGNIDAGIVLQLVKKFGVGGADKILNKDSGIKGICGESEFLNVLEKIKEGDKSAKLAFDIFIYNIQKYIGSYFAILQGCDVLIFTGSIGAGNPKTRNSVLVGIKNLKIKKVLAINTDEELAIAQKIKKIK